MKETGKYIMNSFQLCCRESDSCVISFAPQSIWVSDIQFRSDVNGRGQSIPQQSMWVYISYLTRFMIHISVQENRCGTANKFQSTNIYKLLLNALWTIVILSYVYSVRDCSVSGFHVLHIQSIIDRHTTSHRDGASPPQSTVYKRIQFHTLYLEKQ